MISLRPIPIANCILAALLAYAAYDTLESLRQPEKRGVAPEKKETAAPAPPAKPEMTLARYSIIEQANIFKNKDIVARPPEPTPLPTTAPLRPLDLELKGTTTSLLGQRFKAIISNRATRKTELYGKGDVILEADNARIVDITRSSVTIERGGHIEKLELYPPEQKPKR